MCRGASLLDAGREMQRVGQGLDARGVQTLQYTEYRLICMHLMLPENKEARTAQTAALGA